MTTALKIYEGIYLTNELGVFIEPEGLIGISDVHIGYEGALWEEEGISIPRLQKKKILEQLDRIVAKYQPTKLVINGDFKHAFNKNLTQEWLEVKEVLSYLTNLVKNIVIVRGNHDNYLKTIVSKIPNIVFRNKFECREAIFLHGHKEIVHNQKKLLIIGHEHPSVRLSDGLGAVIKLPCFIFNRKKKFVVLPAFSPLSAGTDLSVTRTADYLSPYLKENTDHCELYAVSEIGLLRMGFLNTLVKIEEPSLSRLSIDSIQNGSKLCE